MNVKRLTKSLLLIFVVFSFGFLVYKEFLPKNQSNANQVSESQTNTTLKTGDSKSFSKNETVKETEARPQKSDSSTESAVIHHNSKVIAYYFHGNFRCTTCRTIEQYSHDAIHAYFAKELGSEKLEFKPLNVEEPEHRHFVQDYQLFSRSLVLSLMRDGKEIEWKNLNDVWKLVGDKDKFFQYVKDEVDNFLKKT